MNAAGEVAVMVAFETREILQCEAMMMVILVA